MDPLPQELIDKTIDNLPHSSLRACSLVARRWRRRCQKRAFDSVTFSSERALVLWCAKIPQEPGGITSYVRFARFMDIPSWRQPALFGRVLKNLTSLKTVWIAYTRIPRPDQLPDSLSFGEFGKTVECLMLSSPPSTVATIASLVLSFPNLEHFLLTGEVSKGPFAVSPCASQRRPLVSIALCGVGDGVGSALAQRGLTARELSLAVCDAGLEQLLTLSSEVVVELELFGAWSSETLRQNSIDACRRSIPFPNRSASRHISTTVPCHYHHKHRTSCW